MKYFRNNRNFKVTKKQLLIKIEKIEKSRSFQYSLCSNNSNSNSIKFSQIDFSIQSDIEAQQFITQNNNQNQNNMFFQLDSRRFVQKIKKKKISKKELRGNYQKMQKKQVQSDQQELYVFQNIIEVIEVHLINKVNILCQIKIYFLKYIVKKAYKIYKSIIEKNTSTINVQSLTNEIYQEINIFIKIFVKTIQKYYSLDIQIFSENNLCQFLISSLFNHKVFYESIFRLQRFLDKDTENLIEKNLKIFNKLSIQYFDVSEKFSLDERTLLHFKNNEKKVNQDQLYKNIEDSQTFNQREIEEQIFQQITESDKEVSFKYQKMELGLLQIKPYQQSIDLLNCMENYYDPLMKLRILMYSIERVSISLIQFYGQNNQKLDMKIGADEMMPIQNYILSQISDKSIYSQMKLIELFLPQTQKSSHHGYTFTQFYASLCFLFLNPIFVNSLEL